MCLSVGSTDLSKLHRRKETIIESVLSNIPSAALKNIFSSLQFSVPISSLGQCIPVTEQMLRNNLIVRIEKPNLETAFLQITSADSHSRYKDLPELPPNSHKRIIKALILKRVLCAMRDKFIWLVVFALALLLTSMPMIIGQVQLTKYLSMQFVEESSPNPECETRLPVKIGNRCCRWEHTPLNRPSSAFTECMKQGYPQCAATHKLSLSCISGLINYLSPVLVDS